MVRLNIRIVSQFDEFFLDSIGSIPFPEIEMAIRPGAFNVIALFGETLLLVVHVDAPTLLERINTVTVGIAVLGTVTGQIP